MCPNCEVLLPLQANKWTQFFRAGAGNKVAKYLAIATGLASTFDTSVLEQLGSHSSSQIVQAPCVGLP